MTEAKTLIIGGEIEWDIVVEAIEKLYAAYLGEKCRQFIIPILSQGGDLDSAWSLYTAIKNLDAKIATVAIGRVYSCAVIPFLAGHKRYCYPETMFLFHPTTIEHVKNEDTPLYKYQEEIDGDLWDRLNFKQILSKMVNAKHKNIIDNLAHESKSTFMNAKTALKYNIVTKIINKPEQITF